MHSLLAAPLQAGRGGPGAARDGGRHGARHEGQVPAGESRIGLAEVFLSSACLPLDDRSCSGCWLARCGMRHWMLVLHVPTRTPPRAAVPAPPPGPVQPHPGQAAVPGAGGPHPARSSAHPQVPRPVGWAGGGAWWAWLSWGCLAVIEAAWSAVPAASRSACVTHFQPALLPTLRTCRCCPRPHLQAWTLMWASAAARRCSSPPSWACWRRWVGGAAAAGR